MTIIQKLRSNLIEKGWTTSEEIDAAIALDQLYPGPTNFDFIAIMGYVMHGISGAILSTLAFLTPSFLVMLLLSWLYFTFGSLPWVPTLFVGMSALVVGVLCNLILQLADSAIKDVLTVLITIASILLLVLGVNPAWIVLGGFVFGALLLRRKNAGESSVAGMILTHDRYAWWKILGIALVLGAIILTSVIIPGEISKMNLSFLKTGAISFGSGASILPLLKTDVVDINHWLSRQEFIDGIALGQITPGPILITTVFIGYKVGGVLGALSGMVAIFFPTFLVTLIALQLYSAMQKLSFLHGGLRGVLPVFVGMLGVVTYQIAEISLLNLPAVLLALAAFLFNRFLKIDVVWIFGGGLLIWGVLMIFGLV